jgi:signal transduction histidine kinase
MADGEWIALVAAELGHETRNVLMIIRALTTLLRDHVREPTQFTDVVEDLGRASERASRIAERLMQLARDTLDEGPADLRAVVAQQVTTLQRIAPAGTRVALEADDAPLWTKLPTSDAEQIVLNLARNAFDAMAQAGTLTIRVAPARDGHAALTVTDTGAGMDSDTVRRCFDPFFTTKGADGTGVGLFVVRQAVERVGGSIHVDSTPGHGTTVAVVVPTAPDQRSLPDSKRAR